MSTTTHRPAPKVDITILRLIALLLVAVVVNAGITAILVLSVQDRFNQQEQQQQSQGRAVGQKICNTLETLYADKPPADASPSDPSRIYLQNLHQRFGDLAIDLKCTK